MYFTEIERQTSASGKTYRIVKDSQFNLSHIEWLKVYKYEDGETCDCWFPAFEPKNKLFTNISLCREEFQKVLLEN